MQSRKGKSKENNLRFSEHLGHFSNIKDYGVTSGRLTAFDDRTHDLRSQLSKNFRYGRNKWVVSILLTLQKIFLPHGYPDSVSSDYVKYQIYDTMQAFCSSITGALASEAVFKSVGVGNNEATPLAAAVTWLIKSGSGMMSGIIFTWWKGTALDFDNKKWRLFADVINDVAIFLDLITSLFPSSCTIIVFCFSSVARSIVGVAGSATRSSITQHQARRNNSADVSAKDGSQETLVNLVSLVVSLFLLPVVSGHTIIIWTLFISFTFFHIFANYRALRALNLESFNKSRILISLEAFLLQNRIPSIQEVNRNESIVVGFGITDIDVCGCEIRLGVSLNSAIPDLSSATLERCIEESEGKPFLVTFSANALEQKNTINVILREQIQDIDIIEVYVRCVIAATLLANQSPSNDLPPICSQEITKDWEKFKKGVEAAGFNLKSCLIASDDWRAHWKEASA